MQDQRTIHQKVAELEARVKALEAKVKDAEPPTPPDPPEETHSHHPHQAKHGRKRQPKMSRKKKHTGKIDKGSSYVDGHGTPDPHASKQHHAANVENDMPHGLSPQGGYDDGDEDDGGDMGGNSENC